jgi:hypothetical protein
MQKSLPITGGTFAVAPFGFEPKTDYLEGSCSIQLSYGVEAGANNVGVAGFEPTTSWSQTRRDTGLRYTPKKIMLSPDGYLLVGAPTGSFRGPTL